MAESGWLKEKGMGGRVKERQGSSDIFHILITMETLAGFWAKNWRDLFHALKILLSFCTENRLQKVTSGKDEQFKSFAN